MIRILYEWREFLAICAVAALVGLLTWAASIPVHQPPCPGAGYYAPLCITPHHPSGGKMPWHR